MGRTFYGSNVAGWGGSGLSELDPFLLGDLITGARNTDSTATLALDTPGDTLLLRGGSYPFATDAHPDAYLSGALSATGHGTASEPITIRNYPGEPVTITRTAGRQPLVSNTGAGDGKNYIVIKGLTLVANAAVLHPVVKLIGTSVNRAVGLEVAYCTIVGADSSPSSDNHEGIRADFCTGASIHHNDITGLIGPSGVNHAGIKTYFGTDNLIAHNRCWGNHVGIYLKDGSVGNIVEHNLVENNSSFGIVGTEFGVPNLSAIVRHNISRGNGTGGAINYINLTSFSHNYQVYNNLVIGDPRLVRKNDGLSRGPSTTGAPHYAQGGTASTITLSASDPATDHGQFTTFYIYIVEGKGIGQMRQCMPGHNYITDILPIYPDWDTIPDSTSKYCIGGWTQNAQIWDNVHISTTTTLYPFASPSQPYPSQGGLPASLGYCDHNLCVAQTGAAPNPLWEYSGGNRTRTTMRDAGFDFASQYPPGGPAAIFETGSYFLKPAYHTMGREFSGPGSGGRPGPADPDLLLDTSRYGAAALLAIDGGGGGGETTRILRVHFSGTDLIRLGY